MNHPGESLSAYLDGELGDVQRAAVAGHLSGCSDCRAELETVSHGRDLVRSLPHLPVPVGVFTAPAEVVPLRRTRRRRLVAAAASAALIVGVGFGVNADRAVPLPLDDVVDQHVARASIDRGFNVLQVQAVVNR